MGRSGVVVSVDGLENAFRHIVEERLDEMQDGTKKAVSKGGRAVIKSIQASGAFKDISGAYRAGWRMKTEGGTLAGYVATVYNADRPGLAHLIEKGHGGPHPAGAHPHIAPAYEEGVQVFEAALKEALG